MSRSREPPPRSSNATKTTNTTRAKANGKGKDAQAPIPHRKSAKDGRLYPLTSYSSKSSTQKITSISELSKHPDPRIVDLSNSNGAVTSLVDLRGRETITWLSLKGNKGIREWKGLEGLKMLSMLSISECSLETVPPEIASLKSLQALILNDNRLSKLEHIDDLPNLNTLVVSKNRLTSLPSTLSNLQNLRKLSASHNLLSSSSLPDLFPLSNLKEVRLGDNPKISELPTHFGGWGKSESSSSVSRRSLPTVRKDDEGKGEKRKRGEEGDEGDGKKRGLEVVDLGGCSIKSWKVLEPLRIQNGDAVNGGRLYNLRLKGTPLEARESGGKAGFEGYKQKVLEMFPSIRILDNVRFDPKLFRIKEKRLKNALAAAGGDERIAVDEDEGGGAGEVTDARLDLKSERKGKDEEPSKDGKEEKKKRKRKRGSKGSQDQEADGDEDGDEAGGRPDEGQPGDVVAEAAPPPPEEPGPPNAKKRKTRNQKPKKDKDGRASLTTTTTTTLATEKEAPSDLRQPVLANTATTSTAAEAGARADRDTKEKEKANTTEKPKTSVVKVIEVRRPSSSAAGGADTRGATRGDKSKAKGRLGGEGKGQGMDLEEFFLGARNKAFGVGIGGRDAEEVVEEEEGGLGLGLGGWK